MTSTTGIPAPRSYGNLYSSGARMTIKHSVRPAGGGTKVIGAGFVMFGSTDMPGKARWFERHFASAEAAQAFAEKRGWTWEFFPA